MNRPTFLEQREKIIQAYFKDQIKPFDAHFCFCGTLANNSPLWHNSTFRKVHNSFLYYKGSDYALMETSLLSAISDVTGVSYGLSAATEHSNYEDALFSGMCAALDELKQIHIEGGEVIDESPVFEKRVLAITL